MSQELLTRTKSLEKENFYGTLPEQQQPTRVLIGGFDNAGKSTLSCSLHALFNEMGIQTSLYELDRWSDTHGPISGEKTWDERQKVLEVSIDEYAEYAEGFKSDSSRIVIGDIEGRHGNPHTRCLKNSADLGILVIRNELEKDKEPFHFNYLGWTSLFRELDVKRLIKVKSSLDNEVDDSYDLTISGLDRESVPTNPGVVELGRQIIKFAGYRGIDSMFEAAS